MNEELDSQLSAMFDDQLPGAECELLARRLSRDAELKARWGRYAIMGAVIRAERGVRLNAPLAGRVSAVLLAEPELPASGRALLRRAGAARWLQPFAGAAVAAGVAGLAIVWLRAQLPTVAPGAGLARAPAVATAAPSPATRLIPATASGSDSYVVPRRHAESQVVVPSTELANYVVAHSMFSSPVARRNLLSAFMTSESAAPGSEESQGDANSGTQ